MKRINPPSQHIKERADYFFKEQCKRLGPVSTVPPIVPVLHPEIDTTPISVKKAAYLALSPAPPKRGRPRKGVKS